MKSAAVFMLMAALGSVVIREASVLYFTNVRDLHVSQPGVQNYFVVDEEIWAHARPDLSDLRMYDGESQVQYALSEQRGGTSTYEEPARVLNLGSVRGHTEFDLDMGQIVEYDRIRLRVDAKDFVVTASVAGGNDIASNDSASKTRTGLPPSTLYDFTREELGSNSVLKLPPSTFRRLHVKLSSGIAPAQIKGASVFNLQETKAAWTSAGACSPPSQVGRTTAILCKSSPRVPLDRIRFHIDPKQVNFRRAIMFSDTNGTRYGGGGEITRVRMNRAGTAVILEELDVPASGQNSGLLRITVDNGDNPPLAISAVELLSLERRVYFDPQDTSSLKVYYGDERLSTPVYDYARFFKADPAAAKAGLGPGAHNAAYTGRPDERPWSERHKTLMWLAMILAVIVLGAIAIRGLTTKSKSA